MLSKDVIPNNPQIDGLKFRNEYLYTSKVNEIYRKNDQVIKKLFELSHLPSSKYMSIEEGIILMKKASLNLTD